MDDRPLRVAERLEDRLADRQAALGQRRLEFDGQYRIHTERLPVYELMHHRVVCKGFVLCPLVKPIITQHPEICYVNVMIS